MTEIEIRELARCIVEEQAKSKSWMMAYVMELSRIGRAVACERKLLTTKEAAMVLGMSVWQLYKIKEHFTYQKCGNEQSSTLRFNAETLVDEYENYLASKRRVLRLDARKSEVI